MTQEKVHFIGIAGAGMSAVAKLLMDAGVTVTGSDDEAYPPVTDFLAAEGIPYRRSYAAANLPADAGYFVIGKNAKLVPQTNAEVAAAYRTGKPIYSFPEVLARLSRDRLPIVVAGSHGKSTSAALLAHCLASLPADEAGRGDPSFFIGAIPVTPPTSARMGKGKFFVLEGDEYPSSNTDPRSEIPALPPPAPHPVHAAHAHDHVNVFPTVDDYLRPLRRIGAGAAARRSARRQRRGAAEPGIPRAPRPSRHHLWARQRRVSGARPRDRRAHALYLGEGATMR